jgi:zinc transporter, ZIP family
VLRQHARLHTPAAMGLGFGLLAVVALLGQSLAQLAMGNAAPGLRLALLGGAAGFALMMVLDTTLG